MGKVCVVPHQELATSDKAIAHVSQTARTMTHTDLDPTLCLWVSSTIARTINRVPFDMNWI